MKVNDIEIPYPKQRGFRYRLFEILPGFISWSILAFPFILSLISPYLTVLFILGYLLLWFAKSIGLDIRAVQGYKVIQRHIKLPWLEMLGELTGNPVKEKDLPPWHQENIDRYQSEPHPVEVENILHAVIVATYNESRAVIEPTIKSLVKSNFDTKRVILILAYEERGGPEVEAQAKELIAENAKYFKHAMAIKHPANMPGEVIGKGGNITYAAKALNVYLEKQGIDPINVVVTTLDSDNRPHPSYLAALSYIYAVCDNPVHVSFQPVSMFTNNIWDAPAPMRVIATGNSFWMTVSNMRPHVLRNFSAHAQSMKTLIDTNYWSVRTVVEDGHQFWRTYFRYDGKHQVYPIFVPIYQDAVLAKGYFRTLKAQFTQLKRWAWGASDVAYVVEMGYFRENKVNKLKLTFKLLQLIEGYISWSTAPLLLAFSAFIPAIFNPQNYAANQLPIIVSRLQTLALAGIFITLFFSLKTLPPRPEYYKKRRTVMMVLQWIYLPVTTILYNSLAALYSQTRLMFGRYIDKFDVTEKAVVITDDSTNTITTTSKN
ncbi:MAG TPA: glycosyltransferase family 2 protein [Candidatus Saccharimonadales bacterium]|nr:glycosyltransferase family 2 protein [Candidatus Saccharimonadales bacterium]